MYYINAYLHYSRLVSVLENEFLSYIDRQTHLN